MLIYEYKVQGTQAQYAAIEEAIRITQFIRNKCLRLWMETRGTNNNDMRCSCAVLSKEYRFVYLLNSQARQNAADRAWSSVKRFYENCRKKKLGKKGYPQFQHDNRSVEYKTTGWKLEPDGKHITFTDGCHIGTLRLIGSRDLATRPLPEIKRVRLIRRADGYYVQFGLSVQRHVQHAATGRALGIDVGLKAYYTDSEENTVENPRYLRKAGQRLKRLHRRLSRKQKHSQNRAKARKRLAKGYLKVQRQREDFARKVASTLITSCDLIAFEDLKIANLVRNRRLSKSIYDASWSKFLQWVKYYAAMHEIPCIAVAPAFTTQNCSQCGTVVKKSLSVRTHICPRCGLVLDRDHNAARNIVHIALFCWWAHCFLQSILEEEQSAEQETISTVGHTGTGPSSEG